jgi:hypothetical protein
MKYAQFFPLFHVKIHDLKYFILYCPVDVRLHYPFESGRLVITRLGQMHVCMFFL